MDHTELVIVWDGTPKTGRQLLIEEYPPIYYVDPAVAERDRIRAAEYHRARKRRLRPGRYRRSTDRIKRFATEEEL